MIRVFSVLVLSLFVLFLWSGCEESDDPGSPGTASPTLTSFSPTSGTAGTSVTLTGTNFSTTVASNTVKFNGTAATVSAATATSLTVSVPAGATTGKITVQVGSQTATSADDFTLISAPAPTITSFSPTSGAAGASVTIIGTNFSASVVNNLVKFNDIVALPTAATATSLTVIAPEGGSTGKITVQVGTQTATSVNDFVYTTTTISTLAGTGLFGFVDGVGAAAQFNQPIGLAVDAAGNVYVADFENHRIRKVSPTGTVSTLAGDGTAGFADGNGTAAKFLGPRDIDVDASGNLYIADAFNNRIRKITPTGTVSTIAGDGTRGSADGNGVSAQFDGPSGIAVDAAGNMYVADNINHRIRKITPTGTVSTLAGDTSTVGSSLGSTDEVGPEARFNVPNGIAVDAAGNVYVADTGNNRIRKITPDGTVSTLAGSSSGFTDGVGTAARFNDPAGIALDAGGNIYVADSDNNRIRKITSTGTVSTVAGGTLQGFTDGSSTTARFHSPSGIAVDAAGTIYVADRQNHSIRKIQ